MTYTLRQAAKATGKAPNTIRNAIKKQRISASQDETGKFTIDPAELHRVYPPVSEQVQMHDDERMGVNTLTEVERESYEAQIRLLREMVEKAEARAEREEENADKWHNQMLAVTGGHAQKPANTDTKKAGFWSRLTGTG